ncbi:hypothetical protein [Streptomyces sp. NBC_01506]|uniref:hypothetical protein n=1 Tax=Streptomyces sp. NBC_01506 TaxID=2903887 RepID=UPI00386C5839
MADDGAAARSAAQGPRIFEDNWPEKVPTSGLTKGLVLPLETYMISYAEEVAVQQARDTAEIACMNRFGFTDWRTEDLGTSPPPADNASNMPRRYGLTDLAQARTHGYHLPSTGRESTPPPEQDTPEAATVLTGQDGSEPLTSFKGEELPEGGCTGEVGRKAPTPDVALVERLNTESLELSQRTPAVKAAMARWASCMKGRGYQVDTVWETADVAGAEAETADQDEIEVATAEVECKQETDLVKIWFAEETTIQKQLVDDNQQALVGAQSQLNKTLGKAAAVNRSAGLR